MLVLVLVVVGGGQRGRQRDQQLGQLWSLDGKANILGAVSVASGMSLGSSHPVLLTISRPLHFALLA